MCVCARVYTIKEIEVMNLKEQGHLHWKCWMEERKERKQCNYILILKINIFLKLHIENKDTLFLHF